MSVEAVELPSGGQEAATVFAMLDTSDPRLHIVAATPTRILTMRGTYQGDDFVMAGGTVGAETTSCIIGPADELPGAIAQLLLSLSEAASVPLTPRFFDQPVFVPDALVLAEYVRTGAFADLATALGVARLDRVPTWLDDLARGVSATFLVVVGGSQIPRIGTHLVGLPSGWGHLGDRDGALSMRPMNLDQLLAEVDDIALLAASLVP